MSLRDRCKIYASFVKTEDRTLGLLEVTCPCVHLSLHGVGRRERGLQILVVTGIQPWAGPARTRVGSAPGTETPATLRGLERRGQAAGKWEIPELSWTQKTLRCQGEKGKWRRMGSKKPLLKTISLRRNKSLNNSFTAHLFSRGQNTPETNQPEKL